MNARLIDRIIIHSECYPFAVWQFVISILCIVSSFFYVKLAAFGPPDRYDNEDYMDLTFIIAFLIDMLISFNLDYYDKTKEMYIRTHPKVALNYLKSGFLFDFVTTIPLVRLFQSFSSSSTDP